MKSGTHDKKRRTTQLKLGDTERRTRKIVILHRSKPGAVSILAAQVTRRKAPNATTAVQVNRAIDAILAVLGTPDIELHQQALAAFQSGDHQAVKRIAATPMGDYFCKSLGYLGGALKLTPNTDTILAESTRAAVEHNKERTLQWMSREIEKAIAPTQKT